MKTMKELIGEYMDKDYILDILRKEMDKGTIGFRTLKKDTTIFDSQLYGIPYIPKDGIWVKDKNGKCMNFMGQINLKDMYVPEELPKKGILQLFTDYNDISKIDFNDIADNEHFEFIYYEDIDESVGVSDVLNKFDEGEYNFYPSNTCKIEFNEPCNFKNVDKDKVVEVFKEIKRNTEKDVIRFTLEDEKVNLFDSFVYGVPYIPLDGFWPKDENGQCLNLLAQINCEDLKGLEHFPKKGILQIFIACDDCLGLDFDNNENKNFKVVYYENIDKNITVEDVIEKGNNNTDDDVYFPVLNTYKIVFKDIEKEGITTSDYKFDKIFTNLYNKKFNCKIEKWWDVGAEFADDLCNCESNYSNHKCGGYPFFTQSDPRVYKNCEDYDVLLFQLDSDFCENDEKVMWGDVGVGNFFIKKEDLENLNFDNVLYNWDCC